MITLAKHIEALLLEHDCVIIPGFGGFLSNQAEATYDQTGGSTLLPPHRTVGFNQQLQINDGLLVQSYMTAYDASYPSAHLQMEKEIEQMKMELDVNGHYNIENVGRLTKGISGQIIFEAQDKDLPSPSLYGLGAFSMEPVKNIIERRETEERMQAASIGIKKEADKERKAEEGRKKDIVIRLNPKWVDIGISVAAAVLLFFGISYTAIKDVATESDTVIAATYPISENNKIETEGGGTKQHSARAAKKETVKAAKKEAKRAETRKEGSDAGTDTGSSSAATATEDHKTPLAQRTIEQKEQTTDKSATINEAKYTIVLASYVGRSNAESYIKQMSQRGFKEAEYIKKGKVSRIIYSGYATEQEAQTALSVLREKDSKDFAEAWVMAL